MATFRFTSLLWKVLELMMHCHDRDEKQAIQHLQCLAGHQWGCDRGSARFRLTEISGFWVYTPLRIILGLERVASKGLTIGAGWQNGTLPIPTSQHHLANFNGDFFLTETFLMGVCGVSRSVWVGLVGAGSRGLGVLVQRVLGPGAWRGASVPAGAGRGGCGGWWGGVP
ncbi:hypothetical protein H6F86_10555 [Phormidium sp. FACHB-592]|uniref:Uncharacterized protein n=2 Tax=Cyanophyceae TaxID=3028117 RepID=A0ABV0KRH6_9CYAN|nr:hypothetical protein [Phormidium sp. FACHB-592]